MSIDYEKLNNEEVINLLYHKAKLLKEYKKSSIKSSQRRFELEVGSSRSKITSLNAKMERDAEVLEYTKQDIKNLINYL